MVVEFDSDLQLSAARRDAQPADDLASMIRLGQETDPLHNLYKSGV